MTRQATSHSPMGPRAVQDQAGVLHRHLQQCQKARSRWFSIVVIGERVHGLVAPRLATTVAVASLAVGVALHWL